jgi:hypothetical protein
MFIIYIYSLIRFFIPLTIYYARRSPYYILCETTIYKISLHRPDFRFTDTMDTKILNRIYYLIMFLI